MYKFNLPFTSVLLRYFNNSFWVPRIEHQVPRIREIGSLQIHAKYLTFSLKLSAPGGFPTAISLGTRCFTITLWEPAYDIFIPKFRPKSSSFRLPYQCHSSSADYARELFKGSNRSAILLVCTGKKFFGWGLQIFC